MTGADLLVRSLLACGVDTCFANPGTSEMHMVDALDRNPRMRAVLALFEGVVAGAADGYARFAERPAATLLHLGPGLANALASLHNARKARSPIVNVVGEHALAHLKHDAPLTSDIAGFARPVSEWIGRAEAPDAIPAMARAAVGAARAGAVATLILPADVSWSNVDAAVPTGAVPPSTAIAPDARAVEAALEALRGEGAMMLVGGRALLGEGAHWAGAIAAATGCRVATQSLAGRMTRGGDRPDLPRVPFEVDAALRFLGDVRTLVCVGAPLPVSFFAYPGKPGLLVKEGCRVLDAAGTADPLAVLQALGEALGVKPRRATHAPRAAIPAGKLDAETIAAAIAATLPEDALVVDESITAGRFIYGATGKAAPHDWLNNMGGALGYALPVAIGAAIAQPGRRVLAMVGDGSAFYTEQALWTMAREALPITVLILANREYAVLRNEWQRVGAGRGAAGPLPQRARDMLSLDRPAPDWVAIARGHGVEGVRVEEASALAEALRRAHAGSGTMLIEAWI
jgi:acetolactate synthase-1/2/3 large subunit